MKHIAQSESCGSWRLAAAGAALALLAACSTTGQRFNTLALPQIVVGHTTFRQAQNLLGAAPVDIYRQGDGSLTARWAVKASMVADALYVRQELSLRFGPDGRFERVVDSVNVPGEPSKPEDVRPGEPAPRTVAAVPASVSSAPNPVADMSNKGIDNPAISYPLSTQ
ncbi:MAG TPA: hypothetical protein VNT00_00740 [Eoetvoesiella sp.]|jgi:hypothetical protein|uniref:hypothetical protein n=1 Tax=Eoetvoesiella sp. TaxID=1966355 RepID=UPI002CAB5838|nr:hypothetical protein [Eoetvoesiella sp.]HWK59918.1 hypothetical protein [Eoetvoesiella sp.]